MSFSLAPRNDTTASSNSRPQNRAHSQVAAANRSGIHITADDVFAAEEHFMTTCDESDSTPLTPREIYVPKTTMEMTVTYIVDHMRFFVLGRVVSLIPLKSTERAFHGRRDKRLWFCLRSVHQADMSERFGESLDEYACVDQSKFLGVTDSIATPCVKSVVDVQLRRSTDLPQLQHHSYVLVSHPVHICMYMPTVEIHELRMTPINLTTDGFETIERYPTNRFPGSSPLPPCAWRLALRPLKSASVFIPNAPLLDRHLQAPYSLPDLHILLGQGIH